MLAQICLTTCGTAGDILPFRRIGGALKARGYDVVLLTHGYYADAIRKAGLDFVALDAAEEFERFVEDIPRLDTQPGALDFFRRHVLPSAVSEYEQILEHTRPGASVLIARSPPGIAARMAAERLGVPLVSLLISPIDISTGRIIEEMIGSTLGAEINRLRGEVGLQPVRDWRAWWRMPSRTIAPWPEWFAAPHSSWPPGSATVGFVLDSAATDDVPQELRDMLGDERPVLLAHGTSLAEGPAFFAVGAQACRLLGRRGILVTRHKKLVPADLPDQIRWFNYLPFARILPSMGAVVHHGGIATMGQALAAGVPQLVLADSSERTDNASYLECLGGGTLLLPPQWRPDAVAEALRRLMNSSAVQERCRDLSRRISSHDSVATACDLIESLLMGRHSPQPGAPASEADQRGAPDSGEGPEAIPGDLFDHIDHLSPERHALLALRLKKTGAGPKRSQIVPSDELPARPARGDENSADSSIGASNLSGGGG